MTETRTRTGGQILVDQLKRQGVDRLTCVPGESYLAVLDALCDSSIEAIVCRNEAGAAMMAEAAGKVTGRPGICFVTRGPGATNASHGVHIAQQDSTPMILFVGQIARKMRNREAFQELDYRHVFGSFSKWTVEIDDAERIPELVARAFRVAMQGRPGPVIIALPEDMLEDEVNVSDTSRVEPVETAPPAAAMEELKQKMLEANEPMMVLGGSRWSAAACAEIQHFAENFGVPVATSFRRAHLFPSDHPNYAGDLGLAPNPKLRTRVENADLLIIVGGRMSEIPTGSYEIMSVPSPKQRLVHVHADANELGRIYQPELAIHATPCGFAAAAAGLPGVTSQHRSLAEEAHLEYEAWAGVPNRLPGNFQYGEVVRWLSNRVGNEAIITNGAGNYAGWIHRHFSFRRFGSQLAPTSGSMGYGVPAAIMAKCLCPEQIVVAFAGDGCFMMNGQEFATAVQYRIPIIIVVVDNGMLGTIRMHQERQYPRRVSATVLENPDFAEYAHVFGGYGERVESTEDFGPAFERALASGLPSILHCPLDPEALTPQKTLTQIRDGNS